MSLTGSIVEAAALTWFGELGYTVGHAPQMARGEYSGGTLTPAPSHGEREAYGEVGLVGRSREAIRRPAGAGPVIPDEASACAWHADRRATVRNCRTAQTGRRQNA